MTRLAVWIGTVGGLGYFPIAPGTVGSAAGVAVYAAFVYWSVPLAAQCATIVLMSLVGIWAAAGTATFLGREDPGPVVIDEVAGQLVTLVWTGAGLWGAVLGFFVFRVLDIIKPYPANRFERLSGGLGIMADDVMAGLYGNLMLQVAVRAIPGLR